jgi:hypothetical protein
MEAPILRFIGIHKFGVCMCRAKKLHANIKNSSIRHKAIMDPFYRVIFAIYLDLLRIHGGRLIGVFG